MHRGTHIHGTEFKNEIKSEKRMAEVRKIYKLFIEETILNKFKDKSSGKVQLWQNRNMQ